MIIRVSHSCTTSSFHFLFLFNSQDFIHLQGANPANLSIFSSFAWLYFGLSSLIAPISFKKKYFLFFFGPRGPLGLSSFVRSSVCGQDILDQLYSSINYHRATANQSDLVWCHVYTLVCSEL